MIMVYFDGLCEPKNPGGIATYGLLIYLDGDKVHEDAKVVGEGSQMSNNYAEYAGLCASLRWLIENGLRGERITIHSDSRLLVNQMRGLWRCHGGLYVEKFIEARELAKRFDKISFAWIPRELNEADALSRRAYEEYCRTKGIEPKYMAKRRA